MPQIHVNDILRLIISFSPQNSARDDTAAIQGSKVSPKRNAPPQTNSWLRLCSLAYWSIGEGQNEVLMHCSPIRKSIYTVGNRVLKLNTVTLLAANKVGYRFGLAVTRCLRSTSYSTPGPVNTWMGDYPRADNQPPWST